MQNEDDGDTLTSNVGVRVPFGGGWAIAAEARRFDTDESDNLETLGSVEKNWGPGYYAQAKAGTNDDSFAYGAAVGKRQRALGRTSWSASYHKNETADDTTELTADGGRQERASMELQHDLTPGFRVTTGAAWRSVETDEQDLGSGYDLHFEAAYGWNLANSRQRSLEIAYVADVSNFDDNPSKENSIVAMVGEQGELIDTDFHRQGAEVRWFGNYGRIEPYTMAGAYYRVDESSLEYEFGAGIDFDVNRDTTVFLRGHYLSSGEGQNSGSGVVEGQVGMERTF